AKILRHFGFADVSRLRVPGRPLLRQLFLGLQRIAALGAPMGVDVDDRHAGHSGEFGLKAGARFSRSDARPSCTSAPEKPRNSSAKDVSNGGPALRSLLLSAYLARRIAAGPPSASRTAVASATASS